MAASGGGFVAYKYIKPGEEVSVPKFSYVVPIKDWNWLIGTGYYVDEVEAKVVDVVLNLLLITLPLLLAFIGIGIWLGLGVSRPLRGLENSMRSLSNGDLQTEITGQQRHDEIGGMANAVQVFKSAMIESDTLKNAQTDEEAVKARRQAVIESAISEFEGSATSAIENVGSAVGQMENLAQTLTMTTEQTATQSATVFASSEEAAGNVQTVAAAAEQLSASIAEISRQVSQSTELSTKAVENTSDTSKRVQSLDLAANKIGEVVSLISDIAEQTNLLALNATIEAARAGEAGRGFAVVASEVKALAQQTARATDEISQQIGEIQSSTTDAVGAISGIAELISTMDDISSAIAAAVEEQGAATSEIAANVQLAANSSQDVTTNIAGVSEATEKNGAVSGEVFSASADLARESDALRNNIQLFLNQIRAA